jgi:hypothetical protein
MLKQKQRRIRIVGPDPLPALGPHLVLRIRDHAKPEPEGDAIEVSGFITEGQFLRLRAPIRVQVYRDGPYWIHEYQPLAIDGIGSTREESKREFLNHFLVCWREYALEQDAKLDAEARKLKRGLLILVDQIEAIG